MNKDKKVADKSVMDEKKYQVVIVADDYSDNITKFDSKTPAVVLSNAVPYRSGWSDCDRLRASLVG